MSDFAFILSNDNLTHDPAEPYLCTDEPFICYGVKVPAPVPVPAFTGGGGGVWPYWRLHEKDKCDDFVDKVAQDLCRERDKKDKKVSLGKGHEKLLKKPRTELDKLREELGRTKGKLSSVEKELKERRKKDKLYGERDVHLQEENEALHLQVEKLRRQVKDAQRKAAKGKGLSSLAAFAIANPKAKASAEAPAPARAIVEIPEGILGIEPNRSAAIAASVKEAALWGLSSAVVFAGTWHLVPDDRKVLKFIGYAGAGALATVAVVKVAGAFTG